MRTQPIAFVSCLFLIAMSGQAQPSSSRDSGRVRIVTSSSPSWKDSQRLRLDSAPVLRIGDQPGAPYELSRVAGAARLSDGRIVVLDGGSLQLRFFDSAGRFVKAAAGKGHGPGELSRVDGFYHPGGDTIAVADGITQVIFYDAAGKPLFAASSSNGTSRSSRPQVPIAVLTGGSVVVMPLLDPLPRSKGDRWIERQLVSIIARGDSVRSIGVLPVAVVEMAPPPMLPWFSAPLSAAAGADAVFIGIGTEYSIQVYDYNGRLTRIIRRRWTPIRITRADIDSFVADWGQRWIKTTGPEAERQREEMRHEPYADTVPAFSQFIVSRSGDLWVRTPHLADAPLVGRLNSLPMIPSTWSVFDAKGRWLGDVTMPARFKPFEIGSDYVLGLFRDEDGVDTVVEYRLRSGG
jgi:hypothetical protein